jgi:hypothetical protein
MFSKIFNTMALRALQAQLEELYHLRRRDIEAEIRQTESRIAAAKREMFNDLPVRHQQGTINDEFHIRTERTDVPALRSEPSHVRQDRRERQDHAPVQHLRQEEAGVRVQ